MSTWKLGDPLHPRHPGIGSPTTLVRLEADEPEVAGVMLFLPSGRTKIVQWRAIKPITPTLEAAKRYTEQIVRDLMRESGIEHPDIQGTNWTSVTAAMQRCILDFNDRVSGAIAAKILADKVAGKVVH